MNKAKAKHEKEITDLQTETQGAVHKAKKFEIQAEKLTKQSHQMEQRCMELKKEYEFVKNKLHFLEENATMASGFSKKMLPPATTSAAAAPNGAMGKFLCQIL
jgi:peptidoglycan hydrolase CwlO-like protein